MGCRTVGHCQTAEGAVTRSLTVGRCRTLSDAVGRCRTLSDAVGPVGPVGLLKDCMIILNHISPPPLQAHATYFLTKNEPEVCW